MSPDLDNTDLDKVRGLIFGLAIGDALGYPTEFMSLNRIKAEFGPEGIQNFPKDPALFSDDTQMSIAVAEALIRIGIKAGDQDIEAIMDAIKDEGSILIIQGDPQPLPEFRCIHIFFMIMCMQN